VAYVLIAAAVTAGPLRAAIEEARARPAATQPVAPPAAARGPIPDAQDGPTEIVLKAIGVEVLALFAPPLLLLWFGWDVWFALAGFAPRLAGAAKPDATDEASPTP
jgi:hypothetical protein